MTPDQAEALAKAKRLIGSEATTCYESGEEARLTNLEEAVRILCDLCAAALRAKGTEHVE